MQQIIPKRKKLGFARPTIFRPINFRDQPAWIALVLVFFELLLASVVAMPDVLVAVMLYAFGLSLVFVGVYTSERVLDRLIAIVKRAS